MRVTPSTSRTGIEPAGGGEPLRVRVTERPEGKRATEAVRRPLARTVGITPNRLLVIRGATARSKVFRVD